MPSLSYIMHTILAFYVVAPAAAVAIPQTTVPFSWKTMFCPVIDSVTEITGDPWQIGLSGRGNITLGISENHMVGTTWTKGGNLGLSAAKIVGLDAGLSASVSETITDGIGESASKQCPQGDWACSLMIYPGMKLVKGHMEGSDGCDVTPSEQGGDFEFKIPRKDAVGNGKSGVEVCTCGNLSHAGDAGHPKLVCMDDCIKTQGDD